MLSEERIKKMIRLSEYESGQGREDLKRVRYLKMDYVRLQVLKTLASVVTAFLLVIGIITAYNIDYVLQNALSLPLRSLSLYGGAGLLAVCIVSVAVTCRTASKEYEESSARAGEYESTLKELIRLYDKEDQGQED